MSIIIHLVLFLETVYCFQILRKWKLIRSQVWKLVFKTVFKKKLFKMSRFPKTLKNYSQFSYPLLKTWEINYLQFWKLKMKTENWWKQEFIFRNNAKQTFLFLDFSRPNMYEEFGKYHYLFRAIILSILSWQNSEIMLFQFCFYNFRLWCYITFDINKRTEMIPE